MPRILKLLSVAMILALTSCASTDKKAEAGVRVDKTSGSYDYLLGKWKRTNDREGVQTYENWVKVDGKTYEGLGFTMEGRDTSWKETMLIHETDGEWFFTVQQQGELGETAFLITDSGLNNFTCENEENEFPKKIVYLVEPESIVATISGGGHEMDFNFERIK